MCLVMGSLSSCGRYVGGGKVPINKLWLIVLPALHTCWLLMLEHTTGSKGFCLGFWLVLYRWRLVWQLSGIGHNCCVAMGRAHTACCRADHYFA